MWCSHINLFAVYIVILSINLFILLAYTVRLVLKPELLSSEIDKLSKSLSKTSLKSSRKKREIASTRVAVVRRKLFSRTLISAVIPVMGMTTIILYMSVIYGERALATRSACSLPFPIELYSDNQCYIFSPWLIFLSFLAILPLYNHLSGLDLLRRSD
ncbi:MAG: hypothetical protein ABWJ42_04220 [Sulfolobales archaeon]